MPELFSNSIVEFDSVNVIDKLQILEKLPVQKGDNAKKKRAKSLYLIKIKELFKLLDAVFGADNDDILEYYIEFPFPTLEIIWRKGLLTYKLNKLNSFICYIIDVLLIKRNTNGSKASKKLKEKIKSDLLSGFDSLNSQIKYIIADGGHDDNELLKQNLENVEQDLMNFSKKLFELCDNSTLLRDIKESIFIKRLLSTDAKGSQIGKQQRERLSRLEKLFEAQQKKNSKLKISTSKLKSEVKYQLPEEKPNADTSSSKMAKSGNPFNVLTGLGNSSSDELANNSEAPASALSDPLLQAKLYTVQNAGRRNYNDDLPDSGEEKPVTHPHNDLVMGSKNYLPKKPATSKEKKLYEKTKSS